jgi:RNA polymerase sigma factor (sigma-70 family)
VYIGYTAVQEGLLLHKEITRETAEKVFNQHSAYIFRIALFLTKSKTLADDVTQETFLQIFKKYHTYDTDRAIEPWIYKITLNITRNLLRKQKWLIFTDILPDSAALHSTEGQFIKSEEEQELWNMINKLSQKYREIIILHYYSDMKLSDIAYTLNIPLGTCKSRLNSALTNLKKQLVCTEITIKEDIYETN